jgi:hypothetical protein
LPGGELKRIHDALGAFHRSVPRAEAGAREPPSDLPTPILYLKHRDLCVDFIPRYPGITAVSRRMRAAMALPDWAASWVPIVVDSRSALEAADQGYQHLHLHARAQAFDLERSIYKGEWRPSAKDGTPFLDCAPFGIQRFEVVEGFEPPADLFNDTIAMASLLATDALAVRVMTRGCTNVVFEHLSSVYGQELRGNGKILRSVTHIRVSTCSSPTIRAAIAGCR